MDWTALFPGNSEALKNFKNSFQVTADSFESCRVTIYLHEATEKAISRILEVNQSLSIKKILDHAANAIHDDFLKFVHISDDQQIEQGNEHAKSVCFLNSFVRQLPSIEKDRKIRKTFVMSKRSERLFNALASLLEKDLDVIINCAFIGYDNHLMGSGIEMFKSYAAFMEKYQELFYVLEALIDRDFIDHIASFSCPKVGEILGDIFNKYQEIESICLNAAINSILENKEEILKIGDVDEIISSRDNNTEINILHFAQNCADLAPAETEAEWDWLYRGGE
jgi:hypothetical protein